MVNKVIVSPKFKLKIRDFIKGAIIAVGTPVLYLVQEMIPNWPLNPVEKAALSALITYLTKNYFAPASVTTVYKSNTKAKEVAETIAENNNTTVS